MKMSSRLPQVTIVGLFLFLLPFAAFAQESIVTGTVTDSTGGVLPGVTVKAVHEATGNTFETVTDDHGVYRLPVRTGTYRLTAILEGFAAPTRTFELLLGQQATINLEMAPSTLQESVTVTGEAPLVDFNQSKLGGNVDPRQMQELPVNGRNWQDLVVLSPGNRNNAVTDAPTVVGSNSGTQVGSYQLNLDGQQVTNNVLNGNGNPRYSRDAIAEFELITNRFDATQGRSTGVQVNAITKSGTNTHSGTFSGYFRSDRFNAADLVAQRVIPYSDQQISSTYGGPIRKDKIHFFVNYEYEREPRTAVYNTPYPRFNVDLQGTRREKKFLGRMDFQMPSQSRLTTRYTKWSNLSPHDNAGGATSTPSTTQSINRYQDQVLGTITKVLGTRSVNELKGGFARFHWDQCAEVKNPRSPAAGPCGPGYGSVGVLLVGLSLGTGQSTPQNFDQKIASVRDDFTYSFTRAGRHDVKMGGEYLHQSVYSYISRTSIGVLDAQGGPIPANIETLFPDQFDSSTWNLQPLSSIARFWRQGVGTFDFTITRHIFGGWLQDDWAVSSRLTLNLGVRYDAEPGAFANDVGLGPFYPANRPDDWNNVGPRLGFAYKAADRTVIRGGWGKYFGDEQNPHPAKGFQLAIIPQTLNDGRADFAINPYNGAQPTFEQAQAGLCDVKLVAGCVRRDITTSLNDPRDQIPWSSQASIGLAQQVGDAMAAEADYVYVGTRGDKSNTNINLSYNPATGANYPFTDISRRPYQDWGQVGMFLNGAYSNYHAVQTSFTRRFRQGWQAQLTYTLGWSRDASGVPTQGLEPVPFPLAPDLGGEYTFAVNDQRHRAVLNGIWQLRYGFQLSGLYLYGSGVRYATSWGGDLRNQSITSGRLRPDGTIVPRNSLVGKPAHRVDLRLQRRFRLGGSRTIDGIVEVFNLLNHANYGVYTTQQSNARYGQPSQSNNVAYQPRTAQLGFRFAF
jgi:Carboxypeptidase regulatory-like domain